jgi:hypothetical protein
MPKLKTNDPLWRELKTKGVVKPNASKNVPDTPEGPYYVGWKAQSHEWYPAGGDNGPETGKGRYKAKGNGGTILARDIQSYAHAKRIADTLDKRHKEGKFYDKSVYGKWGKDWYVNDYHSAYVGSHAQAKENDDEDQWDLEWQEKMAKHTGKRNRPTSFAKHVREAFAQKLEEAYNAVDSESILRKSMSHVRKQAESLRTNHELNMKRQNNPDHEKHLDDRYAKTSELKRRLTVDPHFKVGN